ncbi:tripartite tricarboxylate transporter substrate binding protein [Bradyrhizobium sp. LHD-71]|uniref:Bug family tripartite tricarboxylate transporter substrate binding protein n=1 Tax=Bradyrhizobium sp. LHD-71 TaxID=3072141 RepID=UPI00280DB6A1|nr:tripartite tricarboxylate transporter substrate binding protein [Bradyrhizobium sp. LHD-71]MDQ8728299.1 tripartite tricarboxylate transporter substrate binding protein [Bradyrhizobium sp. LHD-71]
MHVERREALKFLLAGVPLSFGAWAQTSNLRIVVPFAAGSGTDSSARVFAESLRSVTGGTVIVENKPGGATIIGSLEVSRSKPDGSTILYATGGHTTNAVLMRNLPYDPVTSFTPITMLARSPGFALFVPANSPFKTLGEFVAAAKNEPGKLTYGSAGNGNTTHVIAALFCRSAGIEMTHIPYKATPTMDLLAGTIDTMFVSPSIVMQYLKDGKLRALAVSSKERLADMPNAPTFIEAGIDAEIAAWSGFWGPPKMPPATVNSLYQSIAQAARKPFYEEYTRNNGGEIALMPPEQFADYVASEVERYRKLLPSLGIQVD